MRDGERVGRVKEGARVRPPVSLEWDEESLMPKRGIRKRRTRRVLAAGEGLGGGS